MNTNTNTNKNNETSNIVADDVNVYHHLATSHIQVRFKDRCKKVISEKKYIYK